MTLVAPTKEEIVQVFKTEDDGPVVFHNWLKFKPDGGMEKFKELMEPKGVKTIYYGRGANHSDR